MITKERLKELIEQNATIYRVGMYFIFDYKLDKTCYIGDNNLAQSFCKFDDDVVTRYLGTFDELYEQKEQAEFALKYKRIPKTDYLDLPTWEEFIQSDKQIIFYNKDKTYYLDKVQNKTHIIIGYKCIIDLIEELEVGRYNFYKKPLTKENYLEACEICRKLWLGDL